MIYIYIYIYISYIYIYIYYHNIISYIYVYYWGSAPGRSPQEAAAFSQPIKSEPPTPTRAPDIQFRKM